MLFSFLVLACVVCIIDVVVHGQDSIDLFRYVNPEFQLTLDLGEIGSIISTPQNTKSYDFVIDIANISSLTQGWPVSFSAEAFPIFKQEVEEAKSKPRSTVVVGLLGYYSKGKSFLVNNLYEAGRAINPGLLWFNKKGPQLNVREGAGVTTQGISGVYTSYKDNINEAKLLLLDTAGRNAPSLNVGTAIAKQREQISELRSKERLIDDIIIDIADTILYVVDELLNEDQRTILHIIEEMEKKDVRQDLYVIHNFKRLDCHTEEVQAHINQQIVQTFSADKYEPVQQGKGESVLIYKSLWSFPAKTIKVYHVPLFNQDLCPEENNAFFRFFAAFAYNQGSERNEYGNHVQQITNAGTVYLKNYIKAVDVLSGKPAEYSASQQKKKVTTEAMKNHIYLPLESSKKIVILQWGNRELPEPHSSGQFTPKHTSFIYHINNRDIHYIRVDLPGFAVEHQLAAKEPVPDHNTHNWFQMTKTRSDRFFLITIKGYRERIPGDPSQDVYGHFKLDFPVSFAFNGKVSKTFSHAVLLISVEQSNDDEF
jgi:hypothetical protein